MANRKQSTIIASAKAYERSVAKFLAGHRNASTGVRAEADVESEHYRVSVQCKKGQRLPSYLLKWLDGIRGFVLKSQSPTSRTLPIVVWAQWNKKTSESLVICRLDDLKAYVDRFLDETARLRKKTNQTRRKHGSRHTGDDSVRYGGGVHTGRTGLDAIGYTEDVL